MSPYEYTRPFIQPLPVWSCWYLLLLPLCAGVAVVYKAIKCESLKSVPRQAAVIFVMMVGGMVLAGLALAGFLLILERAGN
jgi:hypothetical protein